MGLNPNTWGSQAWHFIHAVALTYPNEPTEQDKENYNKFFYSLPDVLPCPSCGINFLEKLDKNPPALESQETLWKWTVDVHNQVNEKNGKPILSYDEAFSEFVKNSKTESVSKAQNSELLELFAASAISLLVIKILNK